MKMFDDIADLSTEDRRLYRQETLILSVTERIAEIMEQKGVRQIDLAAALDVSKARISKILAGDTNITLRTLADVCDALGVPVGVDIDDHGRQQLDALAQEVWKLNARVEQISLQAAASSAKKELLRHVRWETRPLQSDEAANYQPVTQGICNVVSFPMRGEAA